MLITAVQQSDSVVCIYTFFKKNFLSIMVYHGILTIVLCVILSYLETPPFPNPLPAGNTWSVLYVLDSVSFVSHVLWNVLDST